MEEYWAKFLVYWEECKDFQVYMYQTPMTSGRVVYYTIGIYLLTIFGTQFFMQTRKPFRLKYITAIHNLFLCIMSLVMTIGTTYDFFYNTPMTLYQMACGPLGTPYKGRLFLWYYLFYLSKYYELIDTVILVLRKKPLTFLHVFHHIITLVQFWFNTTWHIPSFLMLGPIVINTFVHVIMYFYFFICALEIRVANEWRQRITTLQLTQFVVDAGFPLAWPVYEFFVTPRTCYGREYFIPLMIYNEGILVAFFILFLKFYIKQYCNGERSKKQPQKPQKSQNGQQNNPPKKNQNSAKHSNKKNN